MPTVPGMGTTFNLPNYHGELYQISPIDTPFLSLIGGLNGGHTSSAIDFEWQAMGRRVSVVNNVALEGADAPTATNQARQNYKNCVEIHQSSINVSYTKQAAVGNFSGINVAPEWDDTRMNEIDTQVKAELESMAVDVELSFLNGTYARPVDNTAPRKTQGILGVAGTISANGGTKREISKAIIDAHLKSMFDAGAKLSPGSTVIMVGSAQKLALSNLYNSNAALNQPTMTRNIGGYALDTIITDFGTFGILMNRWMPADQIAFIDTSMCYPVWLTIPGKGNLFVEPLAKTGASEKFQLYGEIGLEYGSPLAHGIIKDLT